MSWKSLGLSILSLVITIGLLFGSAFLFMIGPITGIIGIVLLIVIPQITLRNARDEATGIIDKVIAKYILPAVTVICGAIAVMIILGLIPSPFK